LLTRGHFFIPLPLTASHRSLRYSGDRARTAIRQDPGTDPGAAPNVLCALYFIRVSTSDEAFMHRSTLTAVLVVAIPAVLTLAACADQRVPTESTRASAAAAALSSGTIGGDHVAGIVAHDACDPLTFNQTKFGPNTCLREGNTTFNDFVAQLIANHQAKGWHFTPEEATAKFGSDMLGNNVGGEVHTFTPVVAYGGSIIPDINALIGTGDAPTECNELDDDDKVASGSQYRIEAEELSRVADANGIARIQCCIHPWMRAEVHLQGAAN